MSNKLKGVARIYPYNETKGERRHKALVREAKKQGFRNSGSKRFDTLIQIIPSKLTSDILRKMLSRVR